MEKIEAVYKKDPHVEQVWVYGNSFESTLVAVVVPSEEVLINWAKAQGITGTFEEVIANPKAKTLIQESFNTTGKEGKLKVRGSISPPRTSVFSCIFSFHFTRLGA